MGCEVGDLVVARFRRSVGDPLVADPARSRSAAVSAGSGIIEHSQFANHNGGSLMFGPDGYLHISVGGWQCLRSFQQRQVSADTLLGKILRIDVDVPDGNAQGYQIPVDNPLVDDNP